MPEAHPCFASWVDLNNEDCMFTADQAEDWSEEHLLKCHWYLEIDPSDTPPHELENRRSVEPSFQRPTAAVKENEQNPAELEVAVGKPSKLKSRGGALTKQKAAPSSNVTGAKENGKGNKRAGGADNEQAGSSKKGRHDLDGAQSEARSSKSNSHVTRSIGGGYLSTLRTSLIKRAAEGVKYQEQVINSSVGDFLQSDASTFEEFAQMVHSSQYT